MVDDVIVSPIVYFQVLNLAVLRAAQLISGLLSTRGAEQSRDNTSNSVDILLTTRCARRWGGLEEHSLCRRDGGL